MTVHVNDNEKSFTQAPYRISIALSSFIEFESEKPKQNIDQLLGPNGLAMTYSIARGIVGQATGTAPHGKFLLPTVNFIELLRKKFAKNMQNDSASTH